MQLLEIVSTILFILVAFFLAANLSPVAAGVFAALPIRLSLSLFAVSALGTEALKQAVAASFVGLGAGFTFVGTLYLALARYPINASFAIAATVAILFTIIVYILKYGA